MPQVDVAILRAFHEAHGNEVSAETLLCVTNRSAAEMAERIEILRGAGYQIVTRGSGSNLFYRLVARPNHLIADDLRAALDPCRIGKEIIVLEETSSTNDFVLQMAKANVPEGLVVFAEHQTAGRGQRHNRWESAPHKGLWFSILLRPRISVAESARLTRWAAEEIAETIHEQLGLRATIKPPNDVYLEDRKVAGVLVEMRAVEGNGYLAIAGIGINVNQTPEDFSPDLRSRASSLGMMAAKQIDRYEFTVALLRNLDRTYRDLFW